MFVALLRLDLRLPDASSLKDKRSVVKGVAAALRKLNCAVAEVDHQDLRQRATLAVATVAGEGFHARRVLVNAEREVERTPGVELLSSDVTLYGPEDRETPPWPSPVTHEPAASPRPSGGWSASGSRARRWTWHCLAERKARARW
jgi:hypothetical protein